MNLQHTDLRSHSAPANDAHLVPALVELSQQLNAAASSEEAVHIIADVADAVLGWDAFFLGYYDAPTDLVHGVLALDLVDGQRCEMLGRAPNGPPSQIARRVLDDGPLLVLRDGSSADVEGYRFGDEQRLSASLLYVPVRSGQAIVGLLSTQSYTPGAYDQDDLRLLQALADLCGGALQRIAAQTALRESEERFRLLFEHSPDAIFLLDPSEPNDLWPIVDCNAVACQLHGFTREELIGQSLDLLRVQQTTPEDDASYLHELRRAQTIQFESLNRTKDGQVIAIESAASLVMVGGRELVLEIDRDITARQRIEAALRASEAETRALLAAMTDVILVLDAAGRYLKIAPTNGSLLYRPADSLLGRTIHETFPPEKADQFQAIIHRALEIGRPVSHEYELAVGEGLHWFSATVAPMSSDQVVWVARDITERKGAEQQLAHQALHDSLTGLPNRALFLDRLTHAVERAQRPETPPFAVLFLDLDRFKRINDRFGHLVGDMVLVEVGRRLQHCVRPGDTIARLSGDEFAVLLDDLVESADTVRMAERILELLSQPLTPNGHDLLISTSIGIALSTTGYLQPSEMLRDADTALYRAKALGRARYTIFDQRMHTHTLALLQLEGELAPAIGGNQLQVYFQPILAAAGNRPLLTVEAIVHWQHPTLGLLPPERFIPLAEETGLIVTLGAWVIRAACRQLRVWDETGLPGLRVAVNLTARQFRHPSLLALVADVLHETGLAPHRLELEIEESCVMDDSAGAMVALQTLHGLGVRLALDNFGSGSSSLSALRHLPFSTIKIDRSIVRVMGHDRRDAGLVAGMIAMSHHLDMEVTAVGVETGEQLRLLQKHGCDTAQGAHFSLALPPDVLALRFGQPDDSRVEQSRCPHQTYPCNLQKPLPI